MIGASDAQPSPILSRSSKTLAPGIGDIERTPGREKLGGTSELGYLSIPALPAPVIFL